MPRNIENVRFGSEVAPLAFQVTGSGMGHKAEVPRWPFRGELSSQFGQKQRSESKDMRLLRRQIHFAQEGLEAGVISNGFEQRLADDPSKANILLLV